MTAPFARLESRSAAAVIKHLANAQAVMGAATFGVVFDAASQRVIDGMVTDAGPQITAASTDVATAVYGTAIVVAGNNYTVTVPDPDGTGMTVLQLRKA